MTNQSLQIFFTKPDKYKLLEDATYKSDTMINIGSNLSYSPLGFFKDSLSINIHNFNRILNFDIKNKRITVEAGITLFELLNFTLSHNLWIPQLPWLSINYCRRCCSSNLMESHVLYMELLEDQLKAFYYFIKRMVG